MPLWLDHALFGNGRGMKSPYWDNQFFWLVDHKRKRRGQMYTWIGGFGAQLMSREWTMPRIGTERHLFGRTFRVFQAHRKWLRVEVSWSATHLRGCEYTDIAALKNELMEPRP